MGRVTKKDATGVRAPVVVADAGTKHVILMAGSAFRHTAFTQEQLEGKVDLIVDVSVSLQNFT